MLFEKIAENYKQAMKQKDAAMVATLSFLRAQLKNVAIEKRQETLEDADVITVIKKQVKQRQDSIEQFEKGGRTDLAEKEKAELAVLKSYLPEELSEAALGALIDEVVKASGASSLKDMGKVMKEVQAKVAGRADGKAVSEMVKAKLSGG